MGGNKVLVVVGMTLRIYSNFERVAVVPRPAPRPAQIITDSMFLVRSFVAESLPQYSDEAHTGPIYIVETVTVQIFAAEYLLK